MNNTQLTQCLGWMCVLSHHTKGCLVVVVHLVNVLVNTHVMQRTAGDAVTLVPASEGFFTSYSRDGRYVTYYGDNHPKYAGNVVKAMASARDGYPHVRALFERELMAMDRSPEAQAERDRAWNALVARLVDRVPGQAGLHRQESLGQVASQTLSNLEVISYGIPKPILRPLIGMDKQEIIAKVKGAAEHDHQVHAFVFGADGKFYFNCGNEFHDLLQPDGTSVGTQALLPGGELEDLPPPSASLLGLYGGTIIRQMQRIGDSCDWSRNRFTLDEGHFFYERVLGPAMDEARCARAMAYGMMAVEPGIDLLAVGEMGIANTTAAAALCLWGGYLLRGSAPRRSCRDTARCFCVLPATRRSSFRRWNSAGASAA